MDLQGLRVTVMGTGLSGSTAALWLGSRGADVLLSDIRPLEDWPGDLLSACREIGIRTEGGGHSEEALSAPDLIVASPGINPLVPPLSEIIRAGMPVVGELYLGLSFWEGPVIGVTGTNGKTTTTMLVAEMLKASGIRCACAGNIGLPVCALLDKVDPGTVAVVEVSSFQLDYFPEYPPHGMRAPGFKGAGWLNLAPDHLDRYPGLKEYGMSKARMLDFQRPEDWVVLNAGDRNLAAWSARARGTRFLFGKGPGRVPGAWYEEDTVEYIDLQGGKETYGLEGWSLAGEHNLENLCAAVCLAKSCGATGSGIQEAVKGFVAPAHRLAHVASMGGVDYYDDSKATNVAAAIRAMAAVPVPKVLVAGGRGKGEDYLPLARAAKKARVRSVVAIGEEARRLKDAFDAYGVPVILVDGARGGTEVMDAAVKEARRLASPGDAVLLSPACASFDLFADYKERGRAFCRAVTQGDAR